MPCEAPQTFLHSCLRRIGYTTGLRRSGLCLSFGTETCSPPRSFRRTNPSQAPSQHVGRDELRETSQSQRVVGGLSGCYRPRPPAFPSWAHGLRPFRYRVGARQTRAVGAGAEEWPQQRPCGLAPTTHPQNPTQQLHRPAQSAGRIELTNRSPSARNCSCLRVRLTPDRTPLDASRAALPHFWEFRGIFRTCSPQRIQAPPRADGGP